MQLMFVRIIVDVPARLVIRVKHGKRVKPIKVQQLVQQFNLFVGVCNSN